MKLGMEMSRSISQNACLLMGNVLENDHSWWVIIWTLCHTERLFTCCVDVYRTVFAPVADSVDRFESPWAFCLSYLLIFCCKLFISFLSTAHTGNPSEGGDRHVPGCPSACQQHQCLPGDCRGCAHHVRSPWHGQAHRGQQRWEWEILQRYHTCHGQSDREQVGFS